MSYISYENGQTLFGKVGNAIKGQEGLLSDTVGWTGKNELKNKAVSTSGNNVTFTVNSDGSVTVNTGEGGASANTTLILSGAADYDYSKLRGRTFKIIGGYGTANQYVECYIASPQSWNRDNTGNGKTFTFPDAESASFNINITIKSGEVVSNKTFYPMLMDARISDSTYEPHHDSVDACKADNSVIAPTENGSTASQAYAQGAHFIRNKKFCTAITSIASGATLTNNTNYTEGDVASALSSGGGGNSPFPAWTDIPSSDKVEAANSSVTMGDLLNSFFDKIDASKLGANSKMVIYNSSYNVSYCIPLMSIGYASGIVTRFNFALMFGVSNSLYTYIFNVMTPTSGSTLYLYQNNNFSDKTSQTASYLDMTAIAIIY